MKSAAVVLIVLGLACVTRSDSAFAEEYGNLADPSERLISDLTEIDSQTPGLASMGAYSIFMALDEEPKFSGGVLGVPPPAAPPQMQETGAARACGVAGPAPAPQRRAADEANDRGTPHPVEPEVR